MEDVLLIFTNLLIIHEGKTNGITTVMEVGKVTLIIIKFGALLP